MDGSSERERERESRDGKREKCFYGDKEEWVM
jgi:hypothetical protein